MTAAAHNRGPLVAITGATGFLGEALCRHLVSCGYRVRGLVRRPPADGQGLEGVDWYPCQLEEAIDESALKGGVAVLIHCAFETRFTNEARAREVNVEGAKRLFQAARAQGVKKILLVSSLSAHDQACSVYGRSKLAVEQLLDPSRDVALRPGHIIGEGGVFWRTAGMIKRLPLIPLFFGGQQEIQTVALADVCRALQTLLEQDLSGVVQCAEPTPVTLRDFYGSVARHLGKRARFLRLPGQPFLMLSRLAEWAHVSLPLSSDNLNGLKQLQTFDVSDDLERLGLNPSTMSESLEKVRWDLL